MHSIISTWQSHYIPPNPLLWQGREDAPLGSCFFHMIRPYNLMDAIPTAIPKQTCYALIGFKCDEGIRRNLGRVGAADGANAIRQTLGRLAVQKTDFACYDVGNIVCNDNDLETAQLALAQVIALLHHHHLKPLVLGGGHEVAFGHYLGIAEAFPNKKLGIVNFDAHFDMRPLLPGDLGSSGTPFLQIAKYHEAHHQELDLNYIGIQPASNILQLFKTAKNYQANIILADDLHQGQQEKCLDFIDRIIDENEAIYVSLCLDVFANAFAPGVSAPQPFGLYPWHVMPLLRQLAYSGKVVSFDIAELAPRYDIDQHTAKLAGFLINDFLHHYQTIPRP